ncbi:hypothetical protein GOV11_01880 [Candidatus Woesearchaeota archaeon]|nr:hypothetical protein [Candidatus Woesearchaeota archaeon]
MDDMHIKACRALHSGIARICYEAQLEDRNIEAIEHERILKRQLKYTPIEKLEEIRGFILSYMKEEQNHLSVVDRFDKLYEILGRNPNVAN